MKKEVRKEILIKAPIAKVWEHISNREKIARWLMPNDFEASPGRAFSFECESQGKVSCVVKEVVPLRKLVYSFCSAVTKVDTIVTMTLVPEGDGGRKGGHSFTFVIQSTGFRPGNRCCEHDCKSKRMASFGRLNRRTTRLRRPSRRRVGRA
jgi:uncharacterized protein YndB with AHSA1/START domain